MIIHEFLGCSGKFTNIAFISSVPVVYLFNVPLQFMLVSSSEVTLATNEFLDFVMGILDMSFQVESVMCFIVTMFTGETSNIVMNSIHMSLKVSMFSSSVVTLVTNESLDFAMGILDMFF